MSDATVPWYITFGLGGPFGYQYTEVRVPACYSDANQEAYVRQVAVERYGRKWAFNYPPDQFDESIGCYGLTLREVVTA